MQNQRQQYQQFHDESDVPRGIPVGIPVQNQFYQPPPQTYFQQQQNQQIHQGMPPRNINMLVPQVPPALIQQQNSKMYNFPVQMQCQCCKMNVQTIVAHETGNTTILWGAAICCLVGQCCCLPWLFNDCLDKVHYCPNCGQSILRKHAKCLQIIG